MGTSLINVNEGDAQHQLIIVEAVKRGYTVENLSDLYGKSAAALRKNDRSELILQGIPYLWMNEESSLRCDQKQLTKEVFKKLEIPSPKSITFQGMEKFNHSELFNGDKVFACKPSVGTNGKGVELNIRTADQVSSYLENNKDKGYVFLLEEMVDGDDLRIQVIGGKIVAACLRIPAHVVGNGKNTLEELIIQRRNIVISQNPANELVIDPISAQLIREQQVTLTSVIPNGQTIRLKNIANMAQGAHAIDVSDEIDPVIHRWVKALVIELGTGYFALDLMTSDHRKYVDGNTFALEINARAEWMHHTFSERRTHDLASIVLDELGLF